VLFSIKRSISTTGYIHLFLMTLKMNRDFILQQH